MDLRSWKCARTPLLRHQSASRRRLEYYRRELIAVALCAQFLGTIGCTSLCQWSDNGYKVGPEYCKPPAPVAQEWIESGEPEVEDRHIADWWMVFDDPTLNELIQ